mmetsp:Transcript_4614/g.8059  ORF Transcript_4614/g.8059 Transcript_4614/m.8059 type:complete len:102 (-) Transcript_4614:159-464(-)
MSRSQFIYRETAEHSMFSGIDLETEEFGKYILKLKQREENTNTETKIQKSPDVEHAYSPRIVRVRSPSRCADFSDFIEYCEPHVFARITLEASQTQRSMVT